jgi:5-methylcytosine-specific restriction endonuclease McrA
MTSLTLNEPVLVLNKSWTPINTIRLEEAITMLFKTEKDGEPKARIVDYPSYQTFTWEGWSELKPKLTDRFISSVNLQFKIPEVILLSKYDKLPKMTCHFSRRNLYKRDDYTCQYCGIKPGTKELTIDHVVPSSRGGKSSWKNCVLACVDCNSKKANRLPHEAHMKLRKEPKQPHVPLFRVDMTRRIESWEAFLGAAYWNVGIGDDDE